MLAEWGAMTGTLGANAVWDRMPFMAGLNGEEGPHAHRNPVHGVERHMELKAQSRSRLYNLHSELLHKPIT
jgi:hypothetical protein